MNYFWLIIVVAFIIIEAVNPVTVAWIFFSIAAGLTFLLSLLTSNVLIQVLFFSITSSVILFVWLRKAYKNPEFSVASNSDRVLNEEFVSTETISSKLSGKFSYQKINGIDWLVISDQTRIPKGTLCVVVAIDGNKLIVKKKEFEKDS